MISPTGVRGVRPWLLFAAVLAVGQSVYFATPTLTPEVARAVSLAVPLSALALFFLFVRWDGSTPRDHGLFLPPDPARALGVAALLVGVYLIAVLEPGFGFGFLAGAEDTVDSVLYWIAYAPLTALAGEAVFRGYLLDRWLKPGTLPASLGVSSVLFAVAGTNVVVLEGLEPVSLGRLLLSRVAPLVVLGVVLGFYYLCAARNLLGPFVLRTGILLFVGLSPLLAGSPGWQLSLLLELFAYGLVLALLLVLYRPSRFLARAYLGERFGPRRGRFREIRERRRERRSLVVASVAVALVLSGTFVTLVTTLGTNPPFLAISSDSMSPTIHRGDIVLVRQADAASIGVGTVIAYSSSCMPSPVVHRVVAESPGTGGPVYTTRGDANGVNDPCPVPIGAVIGQIVLVVPLLGFFALSPALSVGTVVIAVVAVALLRPSSSSFSHRRWHR